ncbi:MAG: hypothetical protein ACM3ML_25290 [Micromonosporaceae bacterium]
MTRGPWLRASVQGMPKLDPGLFGTVQTCGCALRTAPRSGDRRGLAYKPRLLGVSHLGHEPVLT